MSIERAAIVIDGHNFHRAHADGACMVHQDVDLSQLPPNLVHRQFRFFAHADVSFQRENLGATPTQIIGGAVQCFTIPP